MATSVNIEVKGFLEETEVNRSSEKMTERVTYEDEWLNNVILKGKTILSELAKETFIRYRQLGKLILASGYRKGQWHSEHRLKAIKEWQISGRTFRRFVEFGEMSDEKFGHVMAKYQSLYAYENRNKEISDPNTLVKRKFDVWNIANIDLEKPFGDPDYPGAIPGDIVANVLMWFLPGGGKVVDPMAGGAVTEDVCRALGPKYEVSLYDSKPLKNYQYRRSVDFNDIKTGKLPREAHGADLIFADPPYGPLKEYGVEADKMKSMLTGLADASYKTLKENGLVAVLMQNYYADGECLGEFIPLVRQTAEIFEGSGFHQIFEATVPLHGKVARSEDHMTHIDRRLMVFQVDKSV